MTRERNAGLRKICDCPRRSWPKCAHPWHFNFKPKGGRSYRFSLGPHIKTKGDASTKANALRAAIENGTFGTPQPAIAPVLPAMTLTQLFAKYRREYLAPKRPATIKNVTYQIAVISRTALEQLDGTRHAFGDWRVHDIVTGTIEQYRTARHGAGAATTNRDLGLLRAMFGWAVRMDYVPQTPFKRGHEAVVKLTREIPRARRLDTDEEAPLLAACGSSLRAIVEAALETGCRKGELLSLQWHQVRRLPRPMLVLPAQKTKTRRARHIPISARLRAIIEMRWAAVRAGRDLKVEEELSGALYVFGNDLGEPVRTFKRAWESAVLKAHGHTPTYVTRPPATTPRRPGVRRPRRTTAALTPESRAHLRAIDLHFHDLRRECGSRWLEGGVPLHTVRDWLGHANISQTSTYLEGTIQGQTDAMRRFDEQRSQGPSPNLQPIATDVVSSGVGWCTTLQDLSNDSGKAH